MQSLIHIENGVARMPQWQLKGPVTLDMCDGEQIAIVGDNGSGKTLLAANITGAHPLYPGQIAYDVTPSESSMVSDNLRYITFKDCYGGDSERTYFLQQRWNQQEIDENTPTTGALLEKEFLLTGPDTSARREFQHNLYKLLHLEHLLDKYIILLSSGELRKFKLACALFCNPRVLMIDNPYIGLDIETRQVLTEVLIGVIASRPLLVILLLSRSDEIPPFITHVIPVKEGVVGQKISLRDYKSQTASHAPISLENHTIQVLSSLVTATPQSIVSGEILRMHDVTVRYGRRTVLQSLSWVVHSGEHWLLTGRNGSGKSTLLSLICADNPQAYACDISLFGQRRGSGESIWDIKHHIGYVSPEMHRAYRYDMTALQVVASGLKDTIGLYTRITDEERETCKKWMDVFRISHLATHRFTYLSDGEQRMILLTRAFVKSPALLILDEPFHGLDNNNREWAMLIIDAYCSMPHHTLIMVTHFKDECPHVIDHYKELEIQY